MVNETANYYGALLLLLAFVIVLGLFAGNPSITGFAVKETRQETSSFFDVKIIGRSQIVVEGTVSISDRQRRRGVKVNREKSESALTLTVETPRRWGGFLSLPTSRIEVNTPYDTELEIGTSSGSISV